MSEKSMLPSRLLFCLISISMFLLILSSLFLLHSGDSSFLPASVFKLILVNSTSVYFRPTAQNEPFKLPFLSTSVSLVDSKGSLKGEEIVCLNSTYSTEIYGSVKQKLKCNANQAMLRVFMYDLPPEFHFALLGWKGKSNQTWPDVGNQTRIPQYPGGLNLQHSIEYWLTLDLLSSNTPNVVRPCSVVRVKNSRDADVVFVPFFASLSYNRHSKINGEEKISLNKVLQDELVKFLMGREEWKRLGGKDHLIIAHHPNSMLDARSKLGSAMFVLADFGRYPVEVANIQKDIIAPYKHVVRTTPADKSPPFGERPILLYFRGAIYRKDGGVIRQELYYLLKDEKDVHFSFGSLQGSGVTKAGQGMASSKFCLNIAGDTPSSNRLFDAIASHCVPVIISDEIELPFEDVLDYSEFCVFVRSSDALQKGYLLNLLRGMKQSEWSTMWERLKEIVHYFEYQYPSQRGDAVDTIWGEVSLKISSLHFKRHREMRYGRSDILVKSN